jgi:hypothetical protein
MAHTNTRKEKQMQIFNQAEKAKTLLETLKSGKHVFDVKGHERETVDKKLLALFHFRQYTQMYKFAFQEWDTLNSPEQTYLDIGAQAQQMSNLLKHDVFQETLCSLLWIKAEIDRTTIDQVHQYYMDTIGAQWKEAGLIQGLRMVEPT